MTGAGTTGPRLLVNLARPWGEQDAVDAARDAVAAGLDGVGLADSPRLFPDSVLEAARVLDRTDVALAGPCVLGLGLHHPATVAQSVRTLAAQHPGRVLAVVGRGESSVRNEGLPVPGLVAYEQSLALLRELLPPGGHTLLGAASGPRTITATAAHLGGVLVDAGADAEVAARAVALARQQDPSVEVWLFLRVVTTGSDEQVAAAADPVLGSCAARLAQAPDWYAVPEPAREAVARVAAAHDYRRHGTAGARTGPAEPEAEALVRDRFVVTGTPEQVSARLRPLADLGLGGVVLAGAVAGLQERLAEVAGAVRGALGTGADR